MDVDSWVVVAGGDHPGNVNRVGSRLRCECRGANKQEDRRQHSRADQPQRRVAAALKRTEESGSAVP